MKVIEVKRSIFENNDKDAASLRAVKGRENLSLKSDVFTGKRQDLYPGANGQ